MINMFVGFDQREAVAYHAFCQSVISRSTEPVSFTPLALNTLKGYKEWHNDGSNDFIYSRFLVPYLMGFEGWAIFADGDMICREDIAELWRLKDPSKAVQVVQHDYKTKAAVKYLGAKNEDYPRKNWSSVIIWNCSHKDNAILRPEFIEKQSGAYLHRFSWLDSSLIGELPKEWNWLVEEYEHNDNANIYHYTLGTPCFDEYKHCDHSDLWHFEKRKLNNAIQKWQVHPEPIVGTRI